MKAMRSLLVLVAASTFGGFAACNTTVGECWYYGEGSENAGVGVAAGGGVIVPTGPAGVGGSGDTPPPEPRDATGRPPPECNEEEDDATELGELVCLPKAWGGPCQVSCDRSGVFCAAFREHSVTRELGKLYKCCNCKGDKKCHYIFNDGTMCEYRPETGLNNCP
jgi:hypothetical protein